MSNNLKRWQTKFLGTDVAGYTVAVRYADDAAGRFVGPGEPAEVTAVVVTYNSADDIGTLVHDLRSVASKHAVRLVVVDNDSSDDTVSLLRRHSDIVVVESGGNIGYAAGLNVGLRKAGECRFILFLNPDLRISNDALTAMISAAADPVVGAVVPVIAEPDGSVTASIRWEPSVSREFGGAFFGSKIRPLPTPLSEIDHRRESYVATHDIEWATGAALLVPEEVVRRVGPWDEDYFLYSEEIDYFRRIRSLGLRVRFEPSAVVTHRGAGSGTSTRLTALMIVNRYRYFEKHNGPVRSLLYRSALVLAELLRSYDPRHRQVLTFIANRRRWNELPRGETPSPTA